MLLHKDPNCTQGVIEETELKRQIVDTIQTLYFPEEFHQYALKWFRSEHHKEVETRQSVVTSQQKAYSACIAKVNRLIDMRAAEEITQQEFTEKKSEVLQEKGRLEELLNDTGHNISRSVAVAEDMLTFIQDAVKKFKDGTIEDRRAILAALGSNRSLKDRKLFVDLDNALIPTQKLSLAVRKIHERFEPQKRLTKPVDFEQAYTQSPIVSAQ